jgi:Phage capsid protein
MSKFLSNAAVQEFDAEVKHEYQGAAKLRVASTLRTGVVGDAYKFTRMGKGLANQKASQADVTPMDISHARQTATMENWNAPELRLAA